MAIFNNNFSNEFKNFTLRRDNIFFLVSCRTYMYSESSKAKTLVIFSINIILKTSLDYVQYYKHLNYETPKP